MREKTMSLRAGSLAMATLVALSATSLPTPADAFFSFGGVNRATESTLRSTRDEVRKVRSAVDGTTKAVREVRQEVRDMGDRLIEALRLSTGERSAYSDKQIEAQRRFMDAAQQNESERLRQEFRARAESGEFDPSPNICLLAGMYRGGGSSGPGAIGTNTGQAAVSATSGADPAVRQGGAALARSVLDKREQFQGRMGVQDPTVDPGAILMNPTIASGGDDQQALVELMRNMIDPNPPRPVTATEANTPEGVMRAHRRSVQETRNNASREALSMLANMRTPVQPISGSGGGSFEAYLDDIANYNRPVPSDGMISELQALDIRTLRYYAPKPEVFQARAAMSDRALLQEILDSISIGNRIAFIQLELDSRRAAVETQILSTLNND